jgi:RNA polymerase sigma-70 factor (ECF subfamily)
MDTHESSAAERECSFSADREFLRAVKQGEPSALSSFIERMACVPAVLRAHNARLGRPLDSDELADAAQETLSIVWRKLEQFEGRARLETWAVQFALHELSKALQRKRRRAHVSAMDAGQLNDTSDDSSEDFTPERGYVRSGLERVDAESARILRAKHFENMTFEAIATELSLPTNTVKTRYYRALRRLRELLEPHWRKEEA